jgi:hypothetical protein
MNKYCSNNCSIDHAVHFSLMKNEPKNQDKKNSYPPLSKAFIFKQSRTQAPLLKIIVF